MKFKDKLYAKAIAQVAKNMDPKHAEAMAKRVAELIEKNGDSAQFQKIVAAAEDLVRQQNGDRKITLASARPLMGVAKSLLKDISTSGDTIEEVIDPSLVAGLKVLINDEMQFDGSLKAKLDKMFEK